MNARSIALACAVLSALALLGMAGWTQYEKFVDAAREKRVTAAVDPAPAPLPESLPLTGAEGTGADGYPLRTADGPALRSLLWHKKYRELSAYIEQFQGALEQDWHKEYWVADAISALASGEKELQPALDAWVAASPESFAPWLTRGQYWVRAAYMLRGVRSVAEMPPREVEAMREDIGKGQADLIHAVRIHPGLITAVRAQTLGHMALGETAERDVAFSNAHTACPHCMQHRAAYQSALRPSWGGSYDEMHAFAQREYDAQNARTRFLSGFADLLRIEELRKIKDTDGALALADNLCAQGDFWPFLLARAQVYVARKEWPQARADLDRALHLQPGKPELLFESTHVALSMKQWERAGSDLLAALRVDPARKAASEMLAYTVTRLLHAAGSLQQAGQRDEAIRLLDLAAELEPANAQVQQRRSAIVASPEASSNAKRP